MKPFNPAAFPVIGWALCLISLFTCCNKDVQPVPDNSSRLMFYNGSHVLGQMIIGGKETMILLDRTDTTASNGDNEVPGFKAGGGESYSSLEYFYPAGSTNQQGQYWFRYMRADAGTHALILLDTLKQPLYSTNVATATEAATILFFADSAGHFRSLQLTTEEKIVPGKARIRFVNLCPDMDSVTIQMAGTEGLLANGIGPMKVTPYQEFEIPEGGQYYLNVYAGSDRSSPVAQGTVKVSAGGTYMLVFSGYTKETMAVLPGNKTVLLAPRPRLYAYNEF